MSYQERGVSSNKEDVHNAIKSLDKGLYPNAFCKILPDLIANDLEYCNIMHADTAGTKTSLAYLYWKETGDLSVWQGIIQDAIVMNLDDMACAGMTNNFLISSIIGRNKHLIPGEVISELINGTTIFIETMRAQGIEIFLTGGETADVGDIVRTADVGFTAFGRIKKSDVLEINLKPNSVIVGFSSYGTASYETSYNSGIGSNGLTFARHELLTNDYATKYPETFSPETKKEFIYSGSKSLTDIDQQTGLSYGKLLLSPTRTFLPLIDTIFKDYRNKIDGIIHNTGGGYTKVNHFNDNLKIIKNNILPIPPIFNLIQKERETDWKEMFQVFNCGCRLEVYTDELTAISLIEISNQFNIHAQIIGRVEEGQKSVVLTHQGNEYIWN